jgi:hypothetical protein
MDDVQTAHGRNAKRLALLAPIHRWGWALCLGGIFLLLLWNWLGQPGWPVGFPAVTAPIQAKDIDQHRLNSVPPTPQGAWLLTQDFVAAQDGLHEIELLLVRFAEPTELEDGRFTLTLLDDTGQIITEQTLNSRQFQHNDPYTLRFPAQWQSAGRRYALQLRGNATNALTVWGYDQDVLSSGALAVVAETGIPDETLPATAVQDLRFITRYQLSSRAAIEETGRLLGQYAALFALTLALLALPGLWVMTLPPLRWSGWDGAAWMGSVLALGTAVWPTAWYLFSLMGGRWTGWLLWLVVVAGWLGLLWRWWRAQRPLWGAIHWHKSHLFLLAILLAGLAGRLLAVRDLAAPPWVDSTRHALITAVMVANGRVITDYAPYLPIDRFPYHYGFHTISATLHLLTGWELPHLLLGLGQLINALLPLTVYAGLWLITRRRRSAGLAAFLLALPFFFPAYYATWGRFTQLTAMFILPLLLAFAWLLVRGSSRWRQAWWAVALLLVALFLLHFRVFLFFVPFAGLIWLASWGRHGRYLLLAGATAVALLLPRLWQLGQVTNPVQRLGRQISGYNAFPTGYYEAGWDRLAIWLAAAAIVPVGAALLRRRRWAVLPGLLVVWTAVMLIALAGDYLGLPSTSLINLNSLYISLFLPLGWFLGVVGDCFWRWLGQGHWIVLTMAYVVMGGLLAATTLFGLRQQATIINEQTVLTAPADLAALDWLAANLPADARIAVSAWRWLGSTWAPPDAGAWILPLTGRQTSTPPADYIYDAVLAEEVRLFNEAAQDVEDWSLAETAVWLRKQGITHVFVGARGGFFDPAELARNPEMELLYAQDGVFVFAVNP